MIALGQIYNENCLDTLKCVPANFIDLIITSPPYDNLRTYNGYSFEFEKIAPELFRTLKPGGVVVWVVGDSTKDGSESGTSFRQALHFKDIGFNLHDTMIYMKDNPPPTGGPTRYYQSFEYCFILSRGTPKTFNPIVEPRRNKHNDKRTVRTRAITRNRAGTFTQKEIPINTGNVKLQNVWNYTVGGGSVASDMIAHEHPAIFPEALVRDHIVSWSNEGDVIYDPFMGSGTVAIVAISLNRQYFGSEISTEYVEIAQRRISNHRQSLETFNIIDHILR